MHVSTTNSHGLLVNKFNKLEKIFVIFVIVNAGLKHGMQGHCIVDQPKIITGRMKPKWIHWLDERLSERCRVLYVSFGSHAKVSSWTLTSY